MVFLFFVGVDEALAFSPFPYSYCDYRFRVGVSACSVSFDYWTKLNNLMIEPYSKKSTFQVTTTILNPIGFTLGVRIKDNIYFQTGGNFSEQYIHDLGDHDDSGLRVGRRTVFLWYKSKYFQLPISITYTSTEQSSLYLNVGVKCNFIYYEHLYGENNPVYTQNPLSSSGYNVTYRDVDTLDNQIKFRGISPNVNVGGVAWLFEKRLGIIYYMSINSPMMYKQHNTITDYSFWEISPFNIQLVYNF